MSNLLSFVSIVGYISGILYLVGSSFKDQIYLRGMIVLAASLELYYDFYAHSSEPLWPSIIFTFPLIFVNAYYFIKLYKERRNLSLDEIEEAIYKRSFSKINKVIFKRLIKLAEKIEVEPNHVIIEENKATNCFHLIVDGIASISLKGNHITYVKDGTFLGEMSYLTESLPSATVRSESPITLLTWNKHILEKAIEKDEELDNAIKITLSEDLVSKIKSLNEK